MTKNYTFRKITPEALRFRTELSEGNLGKHYSDYFWFDMMIEGGGYLRMSLYAGMYHTDMHTLKSDCPHVKWDFLMPDGKYLRDGMAFEPEDLTTEGFNATFGDAVILAGRTGEDGMPEGYDIKVSTESFSAEISASEAACGIQFVEADHGYTYYNPVKKSALGWWPIIPKANVEGTVTSEGKTFSIKGYAYMDHQVTCLPAAFGGGGQAWWTWGHFWAGPYTGVFTDSAPTEHYQYRHFSPFMLFKGSDLVFAAHNFTCYVEQFDIDDSEREDGAAIGALYPKVASMKASDGHVDVRAQFKNGFMLDNLGVVGDEHLVNYTRQFTDVNLQLKNWDVSEEATGKAVLEFGAGKDYFPRHRLTMK